jgi:membrane-bound metal-dependent hydrolase YbcI (DUF457 family)
MPITPFHFGPGAALHAIAPNRISFLGFCVANVMIDVEPLYYMCTQQFPLHRFFHTFALFVAARALANRVWLPDLFGWRELRSASVVAGAALGSYSHIIFDSVMHSDITPLAPFSNANPLLNLIPLTTLHWACVAAGAIGTAMLFIRKD